MFKVCLTILLTCSAGACKTRTYTPSSEVQNARSESTEFVQPSGDYFSQLQRLRQFMEREKSENKLFQLMDQANQQAWQAAVASGSVPSQVGPLNLDQWISKRLENPDDGEIHLEPSNACASDTANTERCNSEGDEFSRAVTRKDLVYFRTQPWLLLRRTYQEQDWQKFWTRVMDNVRSPVANDNMETITWLAADTYEITAGNCVANIRLNSDGSFTSLTAGKTGVNCTLEDYDRITEKTQFGSFYKSMTYQDSLSFAIQGLDLLIAKGASYKQAQFGDNVPFYGIAISDVVSSDMTFLPHTYNASSSPENDLIPQTEGCHVVLRKRETELTYRCEADFAGKAAEFNLGLNQKPYLNPRFNGVPISFQFSDPGKVCDRLASKFRDIPAGPAKRTAIASSIITRRVPVGTSVVTINEDGALNFRTLTTPSTVMEALICVSPSRSGSDHDLFCRRSGDGQKYVFDDPRFYDLGQYVGLAGTSHQEGLCKLLGGGQFISWELANSTGGHAVVIGPDGLFTHRQSMAPRVVRSITCQTSDSSVWVYERELPWCPGATVP